MWLADKCVKFSVMSTWMSFWSAWVSFWPAMPELVVTKTWNGTEHGIRNMKYGIRNTEHGIRNIRNMEYGTRNMEYKTCTYIRKRKKAMDINVVTIRRLGNGTPQFRPGDNANMAEAMLHVKDFKQISLTAVEVLELLQNSEETVLTIPFRPKGNIFVFRPDDPSSRRGRGHAPCAFHQRSIAKKQLRLRVIFNRQCHNVGIWKEPGQRDFWHYKNEKSFNHLFGKQGYVSFSTPVGTRGFKSRMCPPYPHACRKRRLKWGAVI